MAYFWWRQVAQGLVSLQSFEFLECPIEGTFQAGVVAGQAILLRVEQVEIGSEDADAAKIPSGRDQFIEEGLLDGAARPNLFLKAGEQFVELIEVLRLDGELLGAQAVLAGVLRAAGLALI